MSSKRAARSLGLLLFLVAPVAAGAAESPCGAPPSEPPWGRVLDPNPPSIGPVDAQGQLIDSSLVMRLRNAYVPVWTPQVCQGTHTACTSNADCAAGVSCVDATTCSNNRATQCDGDDGKCTDGADCVNTWGWQCQNLRSYGWPTDPKRPFDPANPKDPNLTWGFPGPIFRAQATTLANPALPPGNDNPVKSQGTRIKIKLYNYLPPQTYTEAGACIPATYNACSGTSYCYDKARKIRTDPNTGKYVTCNVPLDCKQADNVCLPLNCTQPGAACDPATPPGTKCETREVPQEHPNCFHGSSVTNLHLHGTHVSPQPHQDFVLLNLFPYGSDGVPTKRPVPDKCDATGGDPYYAVGCYQVDVNPLPWNQAPGTHWYHPHKHGGTTAQVQNGMAGALVISGAFDAWLKELYGDQLVDRVMAVQDVAGTAGTAVVPAFFNPGRPFPPQVLLNGYASPKITMQPGEIQRWRFVGGTTQGATKLEIGFDPEIKEARQIAQDGIQFAWENYCDQPLASREPFVNFQLAPGNRVDLLVKAPMKAGTYAVTSRVVAETLGPDTEVFHNMPVAEAAAAAEAGGFGDLAVFKERMPKMMSQDDEYAPVNAAGNPVLFTVEIAGPEKSMAFPVVPRSQPPRPADPTCPTDPACSQSAKPERCWPDTPYYLRDLPDPGGVANKIAFTIDGNPARQPNSFYINNSQYDPSCANVTMPLGATQNWSVSNQRGNNNNRLLAHPFHIHINPFQVLSNSDKPSTAPHIWWDTIALPVTGVGIADDALAGPIWNNDDAKAKCPAVCAKASNATWNGQWTTIQQGVMSVCGCVQVKADVQIRHRFDDYTGGYVIHCHFLGHEDRGMMWNVQTVCKPDGPAKWGQPQSGGGADSCTVTSDALKACGTGATGHGGH